MPKITVVLSKTEVERTDRAVVFECSGQDAAGQRWTWTEIEFTAVQPVEITRGFFKRAA